MNRYCLLSLWTKVATTQKRMISSGLGPNKDRFSSWSLSIFTDCALPASYLKGGCPCIGRELDPDLPRGRRKFYHWTTNALQLLLVQVHASLIGLQELKRSLFGPNPKESMSRVWIPSCARKLCLSIWLNKYKGVTRGLQRLQIQKMTSCMSFHCLLVDSEESCWSLWTKVATTQKRMISSGLGPNKDRFSSWSLSIFTDCASPHPT